MDHRSTELWVRRICLEIVGRSLYLACVSYECLGRKRPVRGGTSQGGKPFVVATAASFHFVPQPVGTRRCLQGREIIVFVRFEVILGIVETMSIIRE